MFKVIGLIFVIIVSNVNGQSEVRRVRLLNHADYMVKLIQEVVLTIEQRGWSSLKVPDLKYELEERLVFDRNYTGTLTFKNGFLVSIKHLDVLSSSLQQVWNVTEGAVRVHLRGQLRMTDVTLGYDIDTDFADGLHHYTGLITHSLLTFDFFVIRIPATHQTWVTVFGNWVNHQNLISILPHNTAANDLTVLFNNRDCEDGMTSWREVFHSIAEDYVLNRILFPEMCYNCAL